MAKTSLFALPSNPSLPIFTYGLLKEGELGHGQISGCVRRGSAARSATVLGYKLLVMDGLPYAVADDLEGCIDGQLLEISPACYQSVIRFENSGSPNPKYKWAEVTTKHGPANMLVSTAAADQFKSRHEFSSVWSSLQDLFFLHGIPFVVAKLKHLALSNESQATKFMECLSAYLLISATFERSISFLYGIRRTDETAASAIEKFVVGDARWMRAVEQSRATQIDRQSGVDGVDFFKSWNRFRNQAVHDTSEINLHSLFLRTREMTSVVAHFLEDEIPKLGANWSRVDPLWRDALEDNASMVGLDWSGSESLLVSEGLDWVRKQLSLLEKEFQVSRGLAEGPLIIDLQAAYLCLWAIFEIVLKRTYPSASRSTAIERRLIDDPRWEEAINMVKPRVYAAWTNYNPIANQSERPFCFDSWQKFRNNIIHRGKSAIREFTEVLASARGMLDVIEHFLSNSATREQLS